MQKVCFVCLQPSRLKCSRCDVIQYCGRECQKKDWKVHKHNCQDNNSANGEINWSIKFNKAKNYLDQDNYLRADKILRKLLEPSIRSQHTHDFLVGCLRYLSYSLINQEKYTEAFEIAQECLDISRSKLGANHPLTLESMNRLAASYIALRQFNQAYELLNECIEKSMIVNGKDHNNTIDCIITLGTAYTGEGRYDEAQKLFRECLQMITNDEHKLCEIKNRLASSCMKTYQYDEAEELYKECLEILRRIEGENHPRTISIMMSLATLHGKQNKPIDQIETTFEECL